MIDIPDQTGQPKLSPISQTISRLSEKLPTKTITKTAIFQESQAGQLLMTHLHALAAFGTSVASVSCAERKNSPVEIHCILAHVSLSLSISLWTIDICLAIEQTKARQQCIRSSFLLLVLNVIDNVYSPFSMTTLKIANIWDGIGQKSKPRTSALNA